MIVPPPSCWTAGRLRTRGYSIGSSAVGEPSRKISIVKVGIENDLVLIRQRPAAGQTRNDVSEAVVHVLLELQPNLADQVVAAVLQQCPLNGGHASLEHAKKSQSSHT
jgi:hypothetical protein